MAANKQTSSLGYALGLGLFILQYMSVAHTCSLYLHIVQKHAVFSIFLWTVMNLLNLLVVLVPTRSHFWQYVCMVTFLMLSTDSTPVQYPCWGGTLHIETELSHFLWEIVETYSKGAYSFMNNKMVYGDRSQCETSNPFATVVWSIWWPHYFCFLLLMSGYVIISIP